MNLDDLYDQLATVLARRDQTRATLNSWTPGPQPGDTHHTPNDQMLPEHLENDRADQARAGRLHTEWTTTMDRWARDTARLIRLDEIAHPPHPTKRGRADTPADAAADGYCRSCFRDNDWHEEAHRPTYRDLCGWCGRWKRQHDQLPPLDVIRHVHQQSRRTGRGFYLHQRDYDRLMGVKA